MAEKCKETLLTVKRKLELSKNNCGESVIKLAKGYEIAIQKKSNRWNFMEFVRGSESGAGPSNCKSMKSLCM
jgi:hypothetical protein